MTQTGQLLASSPQQTLRPADRAGWGVLALLLGMGVVAGGVLTQGARDDESDAPPRPLPAGALSRIGPPRRLPGGGRSLPGGAYTFNRRGELLKCSVTPPIFRVWNATTGRNLIAPRAIPGWRGGHHFSAPSKYGDAWALGPFGGILSVWTGGQRRTIRVPDSDQERGETINLSSDGRLLAVYVQHVEEKLSVLVFETASGKRVSRLQTDSPHTSYRGSGPSVAFGPDDNTLVAVRFDGSIVIWDLETGKLVRRLTAHTKPVLMVAVAPGDDLLAAFSPGDSFRNVVVPAQLGLWEVRSGRCVLNIPVEEKDGPPMTFSPDGSFLALTGPPDSIRLWELASNQEACRWTDKGALLTSLRFAPDGRTLAASTSDRAVTLWDLAPLGWKKSDTLREKDSRRLWEDLKAEAPKAYKAMWSLAAVPTQALGIIRRDLQPIPTATPERIRALVGDLDHSTFARRDAASRELTALGLQAEAELRRALADKQTSVEARSRIELLLKALEQWVVTEPEMRRALRGIWVLERIGSKEAQQVLKRLAEGAPAARQTRAAKAALQRLDRRAAMK